MVDVEVLNGGIACTIQADDAPPQITPGFNTIGAADDFDVTEVQGGGGASGAGVDPFEAIVVRVVFKLCRVAAFDDADRFVEG